MGRGRGLAAVDSPRRGPLNTTEVRQMKITATQVLPTRSGLVVALSVQGPKKAWIRFATVEVPWSMITPEVVSSVYRSWDRERADDGEDQPLPMDFF